MKNGDVERLPSRNPIIGQSATSHSPSGSSDYVNDYGGSIEFVTTNGPSVPYKAYGCSKALPSLTNVNITAGEHV